MTLIKPWILIGLCMHLICACCNHGKDFKSVWHGRSSQSSMQERKNSTEDDQNLSISSNVTNQTSLDTINRRVNKQRLSMGQDDLNHSSKGCNFKGRHLRVAVSPQPPFVDCLQDSYGDWLCNGSNIELIRVLERQFRFVADWIVIAGLHEDHTSPETSMKSSWQQPEAIRDAQLAESVASGAQMSAVIGMVAAGRAMLSANGFMATIDRSTSSLVVSEPFDKFQFHLLLSKPARDHDHIFIKPFQANAWLAILSSACLVMPIFYLINTSSVYYVLEADEHLKSVSSSDCWRHIRAKFHQLARSMYLPLSRNRSSSLTPSDVSMEKEINLMLMLDPKTDQKNGADGVMLNGLTMAHATTVFSFTMPSDRQSSGLVSDREQPNRVSRASLKLAQRRWESARRRWKKIARRRRQTGFFNFAYCVWYVVASLSNQGGETEDLPKANSTRVLIAFWWLYLIVICAIHSGILTAILTFPKEFDFIDNYLNLKPTELASLHLAVDTHSELAHLLVNSDNLHKSSLQVLKEHNIPVKYVNFQRHRQRILDSIQVGKTTLIEERSTIQQIITREYYDSRRTKCLFKSSRYPVDVIPMSLLFSARLQPDCIKQIDLTLGRVMRSGLAKKWRRKFESPGNDCLNSVEINAGDVDKIELRHVVLAFWLLAFGSALGLVFLIGEVVWLFTIGDEDGDDEDALGSCSLSLSSSRSSSLSSPSTSESNDSADPIRLGFRRALLPPHYQLAAIRSFKAHQVSMERLIRRSKRFQKRWTALAGGHGRHHLEPRQTPRIVFTCEPDQGHDNHHHHDDNEPTACLEALTEYQRARRFRDQRSKRSAREAQRRAKRLRRTLELLKRVHGGRIYSDRLKRRVRRLSHSVAGHFTTAHHHDGRKRPSFLQEITALRERRRSRVVPG